jgi:serine/threonine-protein kinase ATR
VLPLNDECGVIEWVPHTVPFRKILISVYRAKEILTNIKDIQELIKKKSKLEIYRELVHKHPAVFHEWLLDTFPEPSTWFASRLAFIRTTAVISMVGYLVGLGDRHGENILIDQTTGDTVHVDFNCLFEKGKSFEVSELVPFRLTHNMVDAFGVTGYEGVFRRSCEVSLRVIRQHKDTLMSVLETFIYDPLVEWSKKAKTANTEHSQVATGAPIEAKKCLNTIQKKLEGVASSASGLSIEGQVSDLIEQATNVDHLSKMFIGWAAYM